MVQSIQAIHHSAPIMLINTQIISNYGTQTPTRGSKEIDTNPKTDTTNKNKTLKTEQTKINRPK